MPSIGQLLDEYGLPPREVLRDWAWQLRDAYAASSRASAQFDSRGQFDDWKQISVASDGSLELHQLNSATLSRALAELRNWIQPASTGRAAAASAPATLVVDDYSTGSNVPVRPITTGSRAARRRKSEASLWAQPKLAVALVASVAMLLLVTVVTTRRQSKPVAEGKATLPSRQQEPLALPAHARESTESMSSNSDPAVEPLSLTADTKPASIDEIAAAQRSASPIDDALSSQLGPALSPDKVEPTVPQSVDKSSVDSSGPPPEPPTDVMQQVAQAINEAQASDLASAPATANDADATTDDLEGDTYTLTRDQWRCNVAAQRRAAPRGKPQAWIISLERPDGFVCQPAQEQKLELKAQCTWQLFDQADTTPRACLVVQAVHRGKRTGEMELRFYGSAEDLPQLTLPLNRKWLDPLLKNLQASQVQLQWLAESLAKTKPPSEARTQMAERKKFVGEQLKLCKRLIEIVAQCDRLADLIDGQVTCVVNAHAP